MAELDLMAPGLLPGVPAHTLVTLSPDFGSDSPAEAEDRGSLESPPEEPGGQGPGSGGDGEEEILCDFCLGANRVRAVKSCLTCMVNYCEEHLRPHQENSKLHSHQLADPVKDRDLRTCPAHHSPRVAFCCADRQCICQECGQGEHKGHASVSLDVARRDKEVSTGEPSGRGRCGGGVPRERLSHCCSPRAPACSSVLRVHLKRTLPWYPALLPA